MVHVTHYNESASLMFLLLESLLHISSEESTAFQPFVRVSSLRKKALTKVAFVTFHRCLDIFLCSLPSCQHTFAFHKAK